MTITSVHYGWLCQMESVSKSMDQQLNQLLEEAEEELQQLEEDSLG